MELCRKENGMEQEIFYFGGVKPTETKFHGSWGKSHEKVELLKRFWKKGSLSTRERWTCMLTRPLFRQNSSTVHWILLDLKLKLVAPLKKEGLASG